MHWLPRWLVKDDDRRVIENELEELYEWHCRQHGQRAADRWLRRQRLVYPTHLVLERLRAAAAQWRNVMPHLWRDVRYSLRSLSRTPVLASTIILTVGIGLGATSGIVSVVRAVLVNPLPYADANNLMWIYTEYPPYRFRLSVVDYRALEADHPTFSAIGAYQTNQVTVTAADAAERVTARDVTGSYFPLLGEQATVGRLFDPSDDVGGGHLVVLSHAYWTRRFGGDPGVLNRTLTIDGTPHTIVGVLGAWNGPLEHDVAVFTAAHWPTPTRKGPFFTMVFGRIKPGVSRQAALDALHATNARLFPIWRWSYQDEHATWSAIDLKSRVVGDIGTTLSVALAAVGCVLLIACANAINLMLARSLGRHRELAVRSALGASRVQVLQTVLTEAVVISTAAALIGLGVALGIIELVTRYGAAYIPRVDEVRMSGPVLLWLGGLALVSALVIGMVPALDSSRLRLSRTLAASGRSNSDGPTARRLRRILVVAEFALATPLIIAAVLVMTSLIELRHVRVGVDTARLLTADVSLSGPRYLDEQGRATFWRTTIERLAELPGVESAALADSRPPNEGGQRNNFDLEDQPTPAGGHQPICTWVGVSPEFFKTVGLRLEHGQLLDEQSLQNDFVVVDRAWANRFFPGKEVVGRRLHGGGCTSCPWTTVIGVVDNVKWIGLEAAEDGTVYFPLVDLPHAFVMLRAGGDPSMLATALERTMRSLDPGLAISNVATGDELVDRSLASPQYLTVLVGMFALAALTLSVIGVYGVMTHFVELHQRDIGVRLAVGGDPADMRRFVLLQGLRLVVLGITIGVGAALLAANLLRAVLFAVSPANPRTLGAVAAALVAIAVVACLGPARRAARLDPAMILREV